MHTIPKFIFVFILTFIPLLVAAQNQDSVKRLPPLHTPRSATVDVQHIKLDLRFDWTKKQVYGTATISLSLLNPSDQVTLDAAMLTIRSIKNEGKDLKFEYDGSAANNALTISLEREHKPNEIIRITIDYHTNWVNETDPNFLGGSNGKGVRFFIPTPTEPKRRKQIWSMGEPESNPYWFPGHDAPDDLRTTEFIGTVDGNLTVISNGQLVGKRSNPDGTQTFHWEDNIPYPNFKTCFVVGEYTDLKQTIDGIEIHNYSYPDEVDAVKASVERLPDMIRFLKEYTGTSYPFPSYAQVFVQEAPWGIGYHTLAIQTENMIDDDRTHADYLYLWDGLECESLAQQWFGNHLKIKEWNHHWLNRSFAHYFDGLYDEYKNGHEEFLIWFWLTGEQASYFADWNSGNRRPVVTSHYDDLNAIASDNYGFGRGAMVLHMLRKHLGEEKWKSLIRKYVSSNANQLVTTENFIKAVEETAGEPMQWFFDQWLFKMGHPVFEVTKEYDEIKNLLTIKVIQNQRRDHLNEYPQTEFFAGKIEIEIDDKIETISLAAKRENIFKFQVPKPKLVNFDFENTWIRELTFTKSPDELRYQLKHSKDILGKRQAIDELVRLAGDEKTSAAEKAKIYAALQQAFNQKTYWRFRSYALSQFRLLLLRQNPDKPVTLHDSTVANVLTIIKDEKAWLRNAAINLLGETRNPAHADLYIKYFNDPSDRVINAAAIALGKSKSPKALNALIKLADKPSWKNQSLISSLYALKELKDPAGFNLAFKAIADLTSPRWTLAVPIWDFRIAAAQTLHSLGRGESAYPMIFDRFTKAMAIHDVNDTFSNLLLIANLGDPRGKEAFNMIKEKYKNDPAASSAIEQYESQFEAALKN